MDFYNRFWSVLFGFTILYYIIDDLKWKKKQIEFTFKKMLSNCMHHLKYDEKKTKKIVSNSLQVNIFLSISTAYYSS